MDVHMTIETQKTYHGKTRAILVAETQSERWISWIRLVVASALVLAALYNFALSKITLATFALQTGIAAAVSCYSLLYLSRASRRMIGLYSIFVMAFLDVTAVSLVLLSFALSGYRLLFVHGAMFALYFIPITFTALHHKLKLSLFAGALAAVEYVLTLSMFKSIVSGAGDTPAYVFVISAITLVTVSLLSGLISHNNFIAVQRVTDSEVRYHNLVHRLPQMLFTLDKDGSFVWANMASYALLGIPSKVIRDRNIREFLLKRDSLRLDQLGVRGTFQMADISGNAKYVDCVIQPVPENNGRVTWEGSITDVTDRELAITQREEMASRLFQYQKMESLGTLASGMAHDFNNILQTLFDLTSSVIKGTDETETARKMELISETLTDAKFLVSELFALGRKQPLDYSSVDIVQFLRDSAPLLGEQLGERYSVKLDIAEEHLWIHGDPNYLKRILQNLFGNARDAMPGGGKLTIECFADRNDGASNNVVIRFSDTGAGMPKEITEKIFDPFFTTKKPGKGTGLGLALVRRIIALHNGRVFVERTGTAGTVFRIEIPESEPGNVEDTRSVLMHRLSATVLLLDDDPKIRDILKIFLQELSYTVLEASNRAEGVQALSEVSGACDVLVMDWKLGDENPHGVINALRAINPDLLILVVSGYAPEQKSINEMNIYRWFTKPYDKGRLDLEIQKALHYRRRESAQVT
jgi:PAS domain S-box-containing protein